MSPLPDGYHQCPRDGCEATVPDKYLMCAPCWRPVPGPNKAAVYRAYADGAGLGTTALNAAQMAAVRAVNRSAGARR